MLVLSRYQRESIHIQLDETTLRTLLAECVANKAPQSITVVLVDALPAKARIGFIAPPCVEIDRTEIRAAKDREKARQA
jgi:sRNA-binding carbon storage regulator CsrA